MLYTLHEMRHALMAPLCTQAEFTRSIFQSPANPASYTPLGRSIGATSEMIVRMTQRFHKPEFGLNETKIGGKKVAVKEKIIAKKPFCNLLNFSRKTDRDDPKILLVAPISGHFATLLRGTVESLLPHHDVYITDWADAKQVPLSEGKFNLDDCISYIHSFLGLLGPETHVIAVCQPASLVLAAISIMASERDPNQPMSMTLMGGPIDTRVSQTEVTKLAESRPIHWFEKNVISTVPSYYPGAGRRVYPGFLQLSGFMSMNLEMHIDSHIKFYQHLLADDDQSSDRHRDFYNEYLSVMDMNADFYLQTINEVFQKQSLPRGKMKWRNPATNKLLDVRPKDIRHTALLTIEGEMDDISARGQTTSAHDLCHSLSQHKQFHHFQLGCGHYGIFNGSKWHNEVMPRIRHFIRKIDKGRSAIPDHDLKKVPDIAPVRFDHDKHGIVAVRRWLKENRPENFKEAEGTPPDRNKDIIQDKNFAIPPIDNWDKPLRRTKDKFKPKTEIKKAEAKKETPVAKPPVKKKEKPAVKKDVKQKVLQERLPLDEPEQKKSNIIQLDIAARKKKAAAEAKKQTPVAKAAPKKKAKPAATTKPATKTKKAAKKKPPASAKSTAKKTDKKTDKKKPSKSKSTAKKAKKSAVKKDKDPSPRTKQKLKA